MQWLSNLVDAAQQMAPRMLASVGLLLAGWILALLLRIFVERVSKRLLDRTRRSATVSEAVDASGVRSAIPEIMAAFVFWAVFLLFAAAAIESLGFTVVTGVLSQIAYYLPNVLGALAVTIGGVIVGKLVRRAASAGARSAGIVRADGIGQAAQGATLLIAAVIALEQIGIDAQLLVILVAVVIGVAFASAGLAFGIGATTTVGNILAAYYAAQSYNVGQVVRIGDIQGEIIRFAPNAVILSTNDGQLLVPAARFNQEASLLVTPGA